MPHTFNKTNHHKQLIVNRFLIIILLLLYSLLKSQTFISEPYFFIGPDEMSVYKQSNDTLINYSSYSIEPVSKMDRVRSRYRIWGNKKIDDGVYALKIERLDSIPLRPDPLPENRFKIIIYKKINKAIIFLNAKEQLTKTEMLNYNTDTVAYKNNFGFTYYSLSKMRDFRKLKKVKTIKDVETINNELSNPKYLLVIEDYKANLKLADPYASGLMATIVNQACIETGYSPVGASVLMRILSSPKSVEEKEKIVEEYYLKINPE